MCHGVSIQSEIITSGKPEMRENPSAYVKARRGGGRVFIRKTCYSSAIALFFLFFRGSFYCDCLFFILFVSLNFLMFPIMLLCVLQLLPPLSIAVLQNLHFQPHYTEAVPWSWEDIGTQHWMYVRKSKGETITTTSAQLSRRAVDCTLGGAQVVSYSLPNIPTC